MSELEEKLASGKDVILDIDVQGAQQIKELMPEVILIFILQQVTASIKTICRIFMIPRSILEMRFR